MKRLNLLILLSFLCGVNNIISQEWETIYDCNPEISKCYYEDAIELSNGKILTYKTKKNKIVKS